VHVTVINNGGQPTLPPSVNVVDPGMNLGFAAGINVALDIARSAPSKYVFVGCHDIRLAPEAIGAMIDALDADSGLGIVGPVLDGQGGTEANLDWISGSGMLLRSDIASGFKFDERFETYVEDVDFCFRVRNAGWRIGRAGAAHAITAGSVDESLASKLMHANTIVLFARHHMWRALARRCLDLMVASAAAARDGDLAGARDQAGALALGLARSALFVARSPDRTTTKLRRRG
jgi:GT2 family glycosyltransferase